MCVCILCVYIIFLEWGITNTHEQEYIRYSHHHRAVRKCEQTGKTVKGKRNIHNISKCRPTAKKQQGKHHYACNYGPRVTNYCVLLRCNA